jgi:hypothetical protein
MTMKRAFKKISYLYVLYCLYLDVKNIYPRFTQVLRGAFIIIKVDFISV